MSLPTLPPAPQGTTQEYDPCAHLRAYQFKPGYHPTASKKKLDPKVNQLLLENAPLTITSLCEIMKSHRYSPEARCIAAITVLNRVYGKAPRPINLEINGKIK